MFIKEKLRHPWTPLYVCGQFYTYKLYIVATRLFKNSYPRYDAITPDLEQMIIDQYADSCLADGLIYNATNGVMEDTQSSAHVKSHVAPITESDLANPHIEFYTMMNPHWQKGDALVTIARVTWNDIIFRSIPFIFRRWISRWLKLPRRSTAPSYI
jgi:hypothetical protein